MTTRHAASGVDDSVLTGMTGTLPTGALNLFEGFARKHAGMVFVVGDVQGSNVRVRVGEGPWPCKSHRPVLLRLRI